ncbi:MAG TPA: hypothetical protein VGK90_02760 [Rhizomicrobium sp.]|jgi:hypothetical protein
MTKPLYLMVSCVLLLAAAPAPAALAADDDASKALADCGPADLPDSQVDSCLERVRVLDETNPSPELQSLEAQLEQRETGGHRRTATGAPRPLQSSATAPASRAPNYGAQHPAIESSTLAPLSASSAPDSRPVGTAEPPPSDMPSQSAPSEAYQYPAEPAPDAAEPGMADQRAQGQTYQDQPRGEPADPTRIDPRSDPDRGEGAQSGYEQPPAGINEDQPPVADPPDDGRSSDDSDNPR